MPTSNEPVKIVVVVGSCQSHYKVLLVLVFFFFFLWQCKSHKLRLKLVIKISTLVLLILQNMCFVKVAV